MRSYLKKPYHEKIGLVKWLKVKALSSSPSTTKNNNNNNCTERKMLKSVKEKKKRNEHCSPRPMQGSGNSLIP
jgi:hypothetical protein